MLFGYEWDTTGGPLLFAWSILPILGVGLITTLKAAALGFVLALALGLVLALAKAAPTRWISWPARVVAEFVRDTPLLIQLFFLYYVLPDFGWVLPAFMTGALALGIQYSAYMAEVYRAGIEAVPRGQREAARALNLGATRTFTHVVLPQAVVRIVPALGNYLVSIMKDVPILSVVTVLEVLNVARIIGDRTFNYLVPLTLVGLIYLLLTLIATTVVRMLERRLPRHGVLLK